MSAYCRFGGGRVKVIMPRTLDYVLSGATLKFSYPDGRTEEKAAAIGKTIWRDPVTHAVENIGNTDAHAIAIDLTTKR